MKLHPAKIAVTTLLLLLISFTVAVKHAASQPAGLLDLLPPESQESEETPGSDFLSLLIAKEPAIAASADGTLPDLLLPAATEKPSEAAEIPKSTKPLRVLIYHTHTTEAYRPDGSDVYQKTSDYRTRDNTQNIVAVGEVLREELEKLGFAVFHDTTDNEPPKLATAYTRSLATMEKYQDENIDIYIDLHRDASGSANTEDIVEIDGKRCARMMFVVGKGVKKDGTEYDPKPNFEKTYAFANAVMENVCSYHENFMRKIRVKNGRYNQHLSDHSLLLEVGHNMNTLQEAKNAVVYFAHALAKTMNA